MSIRDAATVKGLANAAYSSGDYAAAADLGDELVRLDPDDVIGWQIRANSRIFALRHEEALAACDDAIEALERICGGGGGSIFIGTDPRPGMYFNRACVQAKLGRQEPALESLRMAVRGAEKFAAMAAEDDYLESLYDDPAFRAIVARDVRALRTADEREPAGVRRLLARARAEHRTGGFKRAEALALATRVAALAVDVGDRPDGVGLPVEALAALAGMRVRAGDLDAAVADADRAAQLAEVAAVPEGVRALAGVVREVCRWRAGYHDVESADRAVETGERFLATAPPADDLWAEVIEGLAVLAVLRGEAGDTAAIARLAHLPPAGFTLAAELLDEVLAAAPDPARAEQVLQPAASPQQRRVREVFRAVRAHIRELRAAGLDDAGIGALVLDAIRGILGTSERDDHAPALADLQAVVAAAVSREPAMLALTAMSLDLATTQGSLDDGLRELEELVMGVFGGD